jgi:NAD(P)-dependent dehydrogenase (short-subunit alcohol dehydrogenase family)
VSTIAVLGGYGVFGSRVSAELARRGHRVIVAGRDVSRAFAQAQALGGGSPEAARVDVTDFESCRRVVRGAAVVAVCAGPFSALGLAAARAALAEGAHYVDIADDREYIRALRALDADFARARRCAVFGCSSLPAVSSALALTLIDAGPRPARARVTLFIGSANPKGEAAVRALIERLGRPVTTARGEQRGFGRPETVPLPAPFGPRKAYTFDGPEHDLFPSLLGIADIDVRVGFEWEAVNAGLAVMARTGLGWGRRTAALFTRLAELAPAVGTSGGAVMVELFWPDGRREARALVAADEGQRMGALPCAAVAHALATGAPVAVAGVRAPTEVLPAPALLAELQSTGLRIVEA